MQSSAGEADMEIGFFAQWVSRVHKNTLARPSWKSERCTRLYRRYRYSVARQRVLPPNSLLAERSLEGEHILALLDRFGSSTPPTF